MCGRSEPRGAPGSQEHPVLLLAVCREPGQGRDERGMGRAGQVGGACDGQLTSGPFLLPGSGPQPWLLPFLASRSAPAPRPRGRCPGCGAGRTEGGTSRGRPARHRTKGQRPSWQQLLYTWSWLGGHLSGSRSSLQRQEGQLGSRSLLLLQTSLTTCFWALQLPAGGLLPTPTYRLSSTSKCGQG